MRLKLKHELVIINSVIVILILVISTFLTINISKESYDNLSSRINTEIDKSLHENINKAAQITKNIIIDSHNNLLRDSKLISETRILEYALGHNAIPRGSLQETEDGLSQRYRKIRPFIDYKLIAGSLKEDFYYSVNALEHIDIYNKDGKLLGATVGIPDYVLEKDAESIKSMVSSYDGVIDTLDIISSEDGLSFKVYQKIHAHLGLIGISSPINKPYLENIKNITNTEIILYKGSQFIEGTIFKFGNEIIDNELAEEINVFNKLKETKEILITGSSEFPDVFIDMGTINKKKQVEKFRFAFVPLINVKGEVVGMIGLAMSSSSFERSINDAKMEKELTYNRIIKTFLIIAILSVISAMILIYLYANSITKPISELLTTINKVSAGDLDCETSIDRSDEIGELSSGINNMIINLKEIEREKFKRRMSDELREINTNFSSILDKKELLNTLFIKLLEYIIFGQGYIFLKEDNIYDQFVFNAELQELNYIKKHNFSDFSEVLKDVIESKKPVIFRDFNKHLISNSITDSFLSLPIIINNEVDGIIIFESIDNSLNEKTIDMLQAITLQAGSALKNADIFNKINSNTVELSLYYKKLKSVRDSVLSIHGERDKNIAIEFILKLIFDMEQKYEEVKYYEYNEFNNSFTCSRTSQILHINDQQLLDRVIEEQKVFELIKEKEYIFPIYYEEKHFGLILLEVEEGCNLYSENKIDIINIILENLALYIDNYKNQEMIFASKNINSLVNLVAGIAHEMNTPVGICLTSASYVDMITEDIQFSYSTNKMSKNNFLDYLNDIKDNHELILRNLTKTKDLINNFKKISTADIDEKKDLHNLKKVLESLSFIYTETATKTNKKIEIEVDCKNDIFSMMNIEIFTEILEKLLQNSLIHAFNDQKSGKVTITAKEHKGIVNIIFRDSGSGIPKDNLTKIFDPFFTTNRGVSGSVGLGLNYVYNLVTNNLKGEIKCESTISLGTSFIIKFPINI